MTFSDCVFYKGNLKLPKLKTITFYMSLLKATFPLNNSFIDKKQFEDTKGVTRRKNMYRQYKCQMKKGQMDKQ